METEYITFTYKDETVKVLKFLSESDNQFNARKEYIKKLEKANINWKEANRLSRIWYCIKYKNCRYAQNIYNRVMSFDKN